MNSPRCHVTRLAIVLALAGLSGASGYAQGGGGGGSAGGGALRLDGTAGPITRFSSSENTRWGGRGSALSVLSDSRVQADLGLNGILHNTQWVVGPHVHVAVLVGLSMTLYSAIYLLFPIFTNGAQLYKEKWTSLHFWAHLLGGIGMGAFMGMAGLSGMLRRTLYVNGEFNTFMVLAALAGSLLLFAFLVFFFNIVLGIGLRGVIGIFLPARTDTKDLVPGEA